MTYPDEYNHRVYPMTEHPAAPTTESGKWLADSMPLNVSDGETWMTSDEAVARVEAEAWDAARKEVGGKMIEAALDTLLPFIERPFAGQDAHDRIDARMRASTTLHAILDSLSTDTREEHGDAE